MSGVGFYGKIPTRGDFVQRGLWRSFIHQWDGWAQSLIAETRLQLGGRWLDMYLTSPIWRFSMTAGLCGDDAVAGVMIPSVDRVGRYFPLVVASALPNGIRPAVVAIGTGDWFDEIEGVALSALDENCDFGAFESRVMSLHPPAAPQPANGSLDRGVRLPLSAGGRALTALPQALDLALSDGGGMGREPYGLWWTAGSDRDAGSLVITRGLPEPKRSAAFFDGSWMRWGWSQGDQAGVSP